MPGQTAKPLHALAQFTFQTAGASEANSGERTSRCPFGPTTGPDGAAGVLGTVTVGAAVEVAVGVAVGVAEGDGVAVGAGVLDT